MELDVSFMRLLLQISITRLSTQPKEIEKKAGGREAPGETVMRYSSAIKMKQGGSA